MSLESAALKSLDQIAALSADNRALRSQLAEREAEVKRLREAGDALADALDALLPLLDRAENKKGAEYVRVKKATWHTATGGTTDG